MISDEALARHRRFVEAKKQHGGDAEKLQQYYQNLPWVVWFTTDGDIISVGKSNEQKPDHLEAALFSDEQVSILTDLNWSRFRVKTDDLNRSVHYLEVKPVEQLNVSTETDFLNKIPVSDANDYDLRLTVHSDRVTITLHSLLLSKYSMVPASEITARGKQRLLFYFTTPNDPSFLYHTVEVRLLDLVVNKQVMHLLPTDLTGCDVYTIKVFDKYVRTTN
jgi:hypothetical protein